jgi:hypothetical protein
LARYEAGQIDFEQLDCWLRANVDVLEGDG